MSGPVDQALFVAMPERHLASAAAEGWIRVALPLGRIGDVARTPIGCAVYVVPIDDEGVGAPAATWRATFAGWVEGADDADPSAIAGLPPTWLAERAARNDDVDDARAGDDGDDDADEDDGVTPIDDDRPRQIFVHVDGLAPLERRDWVFGNEVVPKQRRGARSFVPMTPTLARLPD